MTELRAGTARLMLEPPLGLPWSGSSGSRGTRAATGCRSRSERSCSSAATRASSSAASTSSGSSTRRSSRCSTASRRRPGPRCRGSSSTSATPISRRPAASRTGPSTATSTSETQRSIDSFSRVLHDKIVSACRLASERLEPAGVVWGQADVDLAVNRRERTEDGFNGGSILGWNPDELVDNQVTVLQVRRPDESAIATVVGYGCHPVTTGLRHGRLLGRLPGPDARRRPRRHGRRVHLLPGRGGERAAEVRLHRHRGGGAPDGHAARARGARGGRRPLQPRMSTSWRRRRGR